MTDQQNAKPRQNDDEIDLVELILELWKGKMLILGFVVVCFCLGFAYVKVVAKTQYSVSTHYGVNLFSGEIFSLCREDQRCLDGRVADQFSNELGGHWSVDAKSSTLTQYIGAPESAKVYSADLEQANDRLTQSFLNAAKEELTIVASLSSDLRNTETVAESVLHAKRMIYQIENSKQQALTLTTPSVQKKSPKVALILVISVLLGGMLGVFAVLMKKFVAELKSRR
ncbi:Wzz/FepE/Etk N-terminal domain-containing protein [Marinomonas pollencensis]|uniref:Chain length determinant protein n=1 Tax=Marinomonas pollencensis TaxID=491954 RepID=A0A3E0DIZ5_9GAMM|nr:Wzz/FepE/Etk N-terminal domain-containing protein [Marinomonas pollencensis]REG82696.1 subunit length determinant protein [Marinomonas pollencensis]